MAPTKSRILGAVVPLEQPETEVEAVIEPAEASDPEQPEPAPAPAAPARPTARKAPVRRRPAPEPEPEPETEPEPEERTGPLAELMANVDLYLLNLPDDDRYDQPVILPLNVRVPPYIHEALQAYCNRRRRPVQSVVWGVLDAFFRELGVLEQSETGGRRLARKD